MFWTKETKEIETKRSTWTVIISRVSEEAVIDVFAMTGYT